MRIFYRIILFILITMTIHLDAQQFIGLSDDLIEGLKVTSDEKYDGGSLWGYMDGGADLYLEYGFNKLIYQELEWRGMKFKLELFEMQDPIAAWGIYSVNHRNCLPVDTLSGFSCLNKFQYQLVTGTFYLNLMTATDNEESRHAMVYLGRQLVVQLPHKQLILPAWHLLRDSANVMNRVKIFMGPVAIDNNLFKWYDWLDDFGAYRLYQLPDKEKRGRDRFFLECSKDQIRIFLKRLGLSVTDKELQKNYLDQTHGFKINITFSGLEIN
ncbi:MAG: hypothetical protein J7L89_06095 [Bacteroidales bacterium]|nr:hypothetical protein [Bacteroidales bacterium]